MKRAWMLMLAVAALALVAVPATAQYAQPEVTFDVVHRLDPEQDLALAPCEDGQVDVDAGGFTFRETTTGNTESPLDGYASTGCARVTHTMSVPDGIEHFHVYFDADRRVQGYGGTSSPRNFVQQVEVRGTAGDELAARRMFNASGPEQDMTPFNLIFLPPAGGAQVIHIDWMFRDIGFGAQQDLPNPFSGEAFASRVENIVIETSGVPADATSSLDTRWTGTALVNEWTVDVDVSEAMALANLRIRADPDYTFSHFVAPDGSSFDRVGTRVAAGPDGYAKDRVLSETREGFYQATVPADVLAQWGPGAYRVVFISKEPATADPVLTGGAIMLAMLPLPFAILAIVQVGRFRRLAFGGFARAGGHLGRAVALVLLYYAVVMGAALITGRLHFLAILPLTGEGVLLYVQVVAAVVAFIVLWMVARELAALTRPAEAHAD